MNRHFFLSFLKNEILHDISFDNSVHLLPNGVYVGSLLDLSDETIMKRVSKFLSSSSQGDLFWSINGIGAPDLTVVYVPAGCRVENPICLLYSVNEGGDIGSHKLLLSNPRVLLLVEEGGEIGVIEEFLGGDGDKSYWVNSVLEVGVGEGGKVRHSYVQNQSVNAAHIKWTSVRQITSCAQFTKYAQQADGGQLTRSLLLAPRATVNVKPNLQIIADDVKCSHGAAITDLEETQLFYFLARGISLEAARKALVYSFGAEVIEGLPYPWIKAKVESQIRDLWKDPHNWKKKKKQKNLQL